MPQGRAGCAGGVVSGKLLVAGGTDWRDGKKVWYDHVDCFDPVANRWTCIAPLPAARGDAPAAVLDDVLYIFGGGTDSLPVNSVLAFRDGTWGVRTEMALPVARRSSAVAVLDRTFFLFGGLAGIGTDYASATSTFWAYRAGHGWESLPAPPGVARFNIAIGAVAGRIVVAGGCSAVAGGVQNLDEIFSYDPAKRTWSLVGRLPVPNRGASGLVVGDRLIYFGGYTDKFETTVWSIDPVAGRVESAGLLPCALADTRFVRIGKSIFGATGENGIKMRFAGTLEASLT